MNIRLADRFEVPVVHDPDKQLDAHKLRLFQQLAEHVPDDAVLANNPWNGSPLAVAVAGQDVLFPYMTMTALDEDRTLLRRELDEIASSEQVCAAAQRLGVEYLLDFGDDLIRAADVGEGHLYPGIDRAVDSDAFEPVAAAGEARLLKLTECAGSTLA